MPEIFLRAYGREIDELIERERLEEAIAHCRYILQTYPKHLETYRHLGKAYLEAKRFGDAADIFQRVLSAVPDDFVSHVGMAIVREDEGNLDAAIWHMERAFETNPSNPAIQQEMKRLISRRDGLEPHKVRLTRGALARMYAHGELFAQAIAELRSALQEDAERPDLQVLLASMYWQTDQRSDATGVATQILEKLPYCAEANRILAANLQAIDRVEEAAVYHRRLANLDPYAAFVESALADAKSVEESAVSLEKLDWVAGEPLPSVDSGQPGWATTLGMEMQDPGDDLPESVAPTQTGPLPSWLEPGEPPPFEAAAEKELREEMESEAADSPIELPGAGFLDELESETSSRQDFIEPGSEEEDIERHGLGLAAASAAAAAGVLAGGEEEESEAIEDSEAALAAESEAATAAAAAGMFDQLKDEEPSDSGGGFDIPDDDETSGVEDGLLADSEAVAAGAAELEDGSKGDIPEWMQEAGWTESTGEFEDAPVSFSDQELDTLDAGQIPTDGPEDDEVELTPAELPDWIHDIAPDESEESVGDESLPGWIGAEATAEGEESIDETVQPAAELEDAGEDGEAKASFPASESDTGEIPTWITDESPGATETIVTWLEDRGPDSLEEDAAARDDLPDWMRDTGPLEDSLDAGLVEAQEDVTPPVELSTAEEDVTSDEPPTEGPSGEEPSSESWLSAVAAVAADEEIIPSSPEPEADEPLDSLSGAMETTDDSTYGGDEQELGLAAAAAVGMIAGKDEDDLGPETGSFEQELEEGISLSAEELGSPEPEIEELAASFEDRPQPSGTSSAPDWLEQIGTLPEQPMQTDSADWLEGLEIDGEESPAEPAAETPDWLKGLAEEGAEGDESGAAPAPDWLREIGEPGSVSEDKPVDVQPPDDYVDQPATEASGGAPDWLQGTGESATEEAALEAPPESDDLEPVAPRAPAQEDDEVMEWLEDLAAKQAEASEEEELQAAAQVAAAEPVLEDREIPDKPEEGLEWLEQLADQRGMDVDVSAPGQTTPVSSEPEPEAEPASELDTAPGWLGRMATQPIPKVDLEALEAAARGESITPDAETIDAQAADIQAQLDEVALQREAEDEIRDGSDDITIDARARDLETESIETPSEAGPDDEIPDWLIAAAEQAEPPSEAPSGLPVEFIEDAGVLESELEPPVPELQDFPTAADESAEPESIVEMEPDASVPEMDDIPSAEEVEIEWYETEEPAAPDIAEQFETPEISDSTDWAEVAELEDLETTEAELEVEPGPISVERPAPEVKKKENLLERSRQALASGDTQSAVEMYGDLVKQKETLDSVIEDLRIAVDRTPDNASLWQVLGDAYMRGDRTDEAIDAYRKGMEAA